MPVLTRVVQMPVFASSGDLIAMPGYHPDSGIYMSAPNLNERWLKALQRIDRPSAQDVQNAVEHLNEPFQDFPFVSDADRAHTIALLLLPLVRELIDGPTPLHLIYKPTPGTGGTLLAEIVNLAATGAPLDVMTLTRWEQEQQRTLTAALFKGGTYLVLDNIHRLDSAVLAGAITCNYWSDRKMGSSDAPSIPVRCGWIATGNNPTLSAEIARRTVPIHLDAQMEHPEDRTGFRHPNLRLFVKANRPRLVKATVTLVRAWQAAGQPHGTKTLGMFESWAEVMGGILGVAGVPGFLTNLHEIRSGADTQTANWTRFVARWAERFGTNSVGVADLWGLLDHPDPIDLGIDRAKDPISQKTRLGQLLVGKRGHVVGAYRLVEAGERQRAKQWRLELVHEGAREPSEPFGEPTNDTFTAVNSSSL